jgi:choline dehydrogenase-like flavoprotein
MFDTSLLSTLAEVSDREFDYVIVGGGCVGTALAHTLLRYRPAARVLIFEQGPVLIPDHIQNLPARHRSLMESSIATPWRASGDLDLAAQVPYLGGRASFWSGWTPQPSPAQLRAWPQEVIDDLAGEWAGARALLGVRPAASLGPRFGSLHHQLRDKVFRAVKESRRLVDVASESDLDAPLATAPHGGSPAAGRFSPVPLLVELITGYPGQVAVVTEAEVQRIDHDRGAAVGLRTAQGGLPLRGATLILANGTVESTRLVLTSFPAELRPLAGRNLNGHVGSWFTCRMPRSMFAGLSDGYQTSALYVDGGTDERQFHIQIVASATTDAARDLDEMYQFIPEVSGPDTLAQLDDSAHVVLLVRGLGEVSTTSPATSPPSVTTGADGTTEVDIRLDPADRRMWTALDAELEFLVDALFDGTEVEYWSSAARRWLPGVPPDRRQMFMMHEAGPLWMGRSPADSVTDLTGRLHGVDNLYVATAAAFPTEGSWNPTLTMVAMAQRLARHLTGGRP